MKKIEPYSYDADPPYAPLYLDDLEQIIDLLKEQSSGIAFKNKEYEFESLDELKEKLGLKVRYIEIESKSGNGFWSEGLRLTIDDREIRIRGGEKTELLVAKIAGIIKARVPWYSILIRSGLWTLLLYCVLSFLYFVSVKAELVVIGLNLLTASLLFLLIFSLWVNATSRGIFLFRKHEVKGLFTAYRRDLILIVISAVVGGLIAKLIERAFS
jgi:hypothetical protein